MTYVMNVNGSLAPSKPEEVKDGITTARRVETELTRHGLLDFFKHWGNPEWKEGKLKAYSETRTPGGRPAIMDLITRLYSFVTAPGIAALGLEGDFLVTADGASGALVYVLMVADGNVFYREAGAADFIPFMEKLEAAD